MDDKITARMIEIENKYLNRSGMNQSGRIQEAFSVGYWFLRVAKIGVYDAWNEFSKGVDKYIEGGGR
jgi:hypothetical protein